MNKLASVPDRKTIIHRMIKYLIIVAGSAVYAVGFQFFMYPNNIVSGGVVGVSMVINFFTGLPVGVMTILMNLPLFIIAWRHFGLEFLLGSLTGMIVSSGFVDLFAMLNLSMTDDPMLACIIGGAVKGAGLGMVYYVGATTGGVDIVAKMIRQKREDVNFGTILLLIDMGIVVVYAMILRKYESAMYSVIAMFVCSKVIDLALYGIDNSSLCYIISERSEELISAITSGTLHRGVTILEGEGAYSRQHKEIILCVLKRTQIPQLRRLVRSLDERAFFVVTDAKNVFGKGFESISEVK